jgi:hypothetical protein
MSKIPKRYLMLDETGFVPSQSRPYAEVLRDMEWMDAYIKAEKVLKAEKEVKKAARKKRAASKK